MARLELHNVSKSFGTTEILRGIDLSVGDGEFCVFVGPSGCGKSTLLRLICGLDAVSGGDICIGGEVVNDVPAARRGMAMVFQSYALYPHMNVASNMGYALRLAGMAGSEIEKRVRETATVLHIEHLLKRRPRELSGGQRQRVAIGRAIVREPRIFLFDEPLSNLDAALRVEMRFELARLKERLGTTTIYVTHDQTEAMTLADNIVVLNEGRVAQTGSPVDLYERPANQFVAGFIGSPKMNFIPASVEAGGGAGLEVRVAGLAVGVLAPPGFASGTRVTLGVRPEHIRPAPPDAGGLRARVLMVERLGSDTFVYVSVEGVVQPVLVRLGGNQPVAQGDAMGLSFDARSVHLFGQDGEALGQVRQQAMEGMQA